MVGCVQKSESRGAKSRVVVAQVLLGATSVLQDEVFEFWPPSARARRRPGSRRAGSRWPITHPFGFKVLPDRIAAEIGSFRSSGWLCPRWRGCDLLPNPILVVIGASASACNALSSCSKPAESGDRGASGRGLVFAGSVGLKSILSILSNDGAARALVRRRSFVLRPAENYFKGSR